MENIELQNQESENQNPATEASQNEIPENKTMEAPASPLIGQATDAEIAAWKATHGDVFQFSADGHTCYLKRPDRGQYAYAVQLQSNPVRSNEYILKNCWLGGSEKILKAQQNDSLFTNVQSKLSVLMDVIPVQVSKL